MKRGRISISVFLCFLMMMLLVVIGCSSSSDAPAPAATYTVTFDSQSATAAASPTSKTVTSPATTVDALPTAPTKTNYYFAGWWTAATSGGTEFTASTTVTASITVYARWSTSPVYTVTYDSQGGSAVGAQHVTSPATTVVTLPAAPTKTGYIFGGWYTATSGGGTAFIATTEVTADITVYAKWNSYTYTVTFNSQSATVEASPTSKTVTSPATHVDALPTAPTKTGSTFAGWYTATSGGGTEFTATTTVMANITVYAKWSTNSVYTVTYDSQGGSAVDAQHVTLPATTVGTLPTAPTKTSYTFDGWYTATSGGGTAFTGNTTVTASLTVYAKWTATSTTYTASGTWSWNSGTSTLTMAWTSSNFTCNGPSLGTQTFPNPTIGATTMTMGDMTWTRSPAGPAGDAHGTWTATDSGNTYTLVISGGTISGTMSLTATITACGSRDYNPGAETQYMPGDSTNKYRVGMWYDDASHSASAVSITGSTGAGITGSQALSYDTTNTSWGTGVNFGNTLPTGLPFTYTFSITDTTTWTKAVTVSCFLSTAPTNLAPSGTIATLTPTFSWTGISAADAEYDVQVQDSSHNEIWRKKKISGTFVLYDGPGLAHGTIYNINLSARSRSTCPDGSSQIWGSFTTP